MERGLPTVVRYGTAGFPSRRADGPPGRGDRLFAGGAGGTAELEQRVSLTPQRSEGVRPRFELSGWFGASRTSAATLLAQFVSVDGAVISSVSTAPVTGRGKAATGLVRRSVGGALPRGTFQVEVALLLATSLKDYDGPDAPQVGYNRAVADDLSFGVSFPTTGSRRLLPPVAHIPRFQHVFLIYFENEDFRSVIGNTVEAPFLNGLLPISSLLGNFYAEEHPSDGNYLALAGGSTFGLPLTDPLEENPTYTIHARNLADLVVAAHESWKGYLQSANGPCDDTVHGWYWDDDLPLLYFADVRDRPRYCAAHLVPLSELATDLRRTSTTPSLSWIGPNDCDDMEGCGITAGDNFLASVMRDILFSPAWTSERSLAIITFDEDGYDYEHPAQLVPTLILGSEDVRRGFTSMVRYTHYSLLRTIEAALGLSSLTANDRYAEPVNDVFQKG